MILTALARYYDRLASEEKVPAYGFSVQKVSYALVIDEQGQAVRIDDLRNLDGKKPLPDFRAVPMDPTKTRTSGVLPYFLWDKTSYSLGVSAQQSKNRDKEHEAFKAFQRQVLQHVSDPWLSAYLRFLETWEPALLSALPGYSEEIFDTNIVFRPDGQRRFIHDFDEAKSAWSGYLSSGTGTPVHCLVTGEQADLAGTHPVIKGVSGGQVSGGYLVSFNINAFESYGLQGNANAPVSDRAAFAYTTALNHLLRRGHGLRQNLQVGDTTVVFWAESDARDEADAAESFFAHVINPPPSDSAEAAKLRAALNRVAAGQSLTGFEPRLADTTRMYVLGLAPNAARISVRFIETTSLDRFAQRLAEHYEDLHVEPTRAPMPSVWALARVTAAQQDSKNIPPQLAGELLRSIVSGHRYPRSLLTTVIMRMRADGDISDLRVALCKAVLAREHRLGLGVKQEVPVSLDKNDVNPGYRLGRLFAVLESAQRSALGSQVNATVRDRYFGAASATPASIFPMLIRNVNHHLAKMRKDDRGGLAHWLDHEIGEILDGLGGTFPRSLRLEDQGRFALGYYHQAWTRRNKEAADEAPATDETENA